MTELKDIERELSGFRMRLFAAAAFVLLCFGLLGARLVYLQIYRYVELSTRAENNRISVVPIHLPPLRHVIAQELHALGD